MELQRQFMISHKHCYVSIQSDPNFNCDSNFMQTAIICENYPIENEFRDIFEGSDKRISDITIYDSGNDAMIGIFVLPLEKTYFNFSFSINTFSREYVQSIADEFHEMLLNL